MTREHLAENMSLITYVIINETNGSNNVYWQFLIWKTVAIHKNKHVTVLNIIFLRANLKSFFFFGGATKSLLFLK